MTAMRLTRQIMLGLCCLVFVIDSEVLLGDEKPQAAQQQAKEKNEEVANQEQLPKQPVLKKKSLNGLPPLKPRRRLAPAPQLVPESYATRRGTRQSTREPSDDKRPALQQQTTKEQIDRQQQVIRRAPARRSVNAPFWSPRHNGLSASAAYRLESLGQHVHLSPTLRWHLNRPNASATPTIGQPLSPAATITGQGAEKFYPGVSRLPTQKPFAGLEQPPSALERYWPLLLEGREDPNTGLIIWSLP